MPTIAGDIVFSAYPAGLNANININQNQNLIDQNIEIDNIDLNENHSNTTNLYTSHVFIAFDLHTGKILWQNRIDGDVMSAPVAKGEFVYVTTFSGTLFQFKQSTGEIISVKAMRATSAPVFAGEEMIITNRADSDGEAVSEGILTINSKGSGLKKLYEKQAPYLDRTVQDNSDLKNKSMTDDAGNGFSGGAPSSSGWHSASMNIGQSNVSSLQSFQGSRGIYIEGRNFNTMGNELICTDLKTGKIIWKKEIHGDMYASGGFMGTPPIYTGKYIIIATFSGEIIISDKESGKEVKKFNIGEPVRYQPVADKGKIFVTSTTGKLHIVNTGMEEITGWTHWGSNCSRTNNNK
jgi:outer membrane protein assembly factor BamB